MGRTILVSNRLPVSVSTAAGGHTLEPSSGGLATALREVHDQGHGCWVGWLGDSGKLPKEVAARLAEQAESMRLKPVALTQSEVALYYDGYSNGALWPLFHYMIDKVRLEAENEWRAYVQVNQRFTDSILSCGVESGDVVWIHDYQLALVPAMLRRRVAGVRIGFFLHTPWPSSDVFRILPSRTEIMAGLLGADLLGFHTDGYRRNFMQSAAEVLDAELATDAIIWDERSVRVGVFPIGIDVREFERQSPEVDALKAQILKDTAGKKIVLGVDRLDYTKGVPRRLLAIDRLLEREPSLRNTIHFIQLAVPTRQKVEAYGELRTRVNELVGRINSQYGSPTSSPVQFLYRSVSDDQLLALYRAADVMLVTPLRDGMNLVAKEYVAARTDGLGALVLSEFAGAASELVAALLVNPYNVAGVASAVRQAMFLGEAQQRARMTALRTVVRTQTVQKWARDFLAELRDVALPSERPPSADLDLHRAVDDLRLAPHRTLLLDYDGTLAPIAELPELAAPEPQLLQLLQRLAALPRTDVHIVTGRGRDAIEPWFDGLPLWLHTEHGFRSRKPDGSWLPGAAAPPALLEAVISIMTRHAERTKGTLVEPKQASVAFHYRRANPYAAQEALRALRAELASALGEEAELLEGRKVLEVRLRGINKGGAARLALSHAPEGSRVLAVGDDRTDEDLFGALPPDAITVKVGTAPSAARLRVEGPREVGVLLKRLVDALSLSRPRVPSVN